MQSSSYDCIGAIGAVYDFLHGVANAAALVAAGLALLQLIGAVFVRLALFDANQRFTIACRLRRGEFATASTQNVRCSVLQWQVVLHAEVRMTRVSYSFLKLSTALSANIVVLSTLTAQRDFQRFRGGKIIRLASTIQHNSIYAFSVNQKRSFECSQEGMIAPWSFIFICLLRLSENDPRHQKGFTKKLFSEFCYRSSVFLIRAGGNGRAGGDTAKRVLPSPLAQPLFESPDQHAHLHALGTPILMRFVKHDELPAPASTPIE